MAVTKGKGVNSLLNSLAGQKLQDSFNCLAPFGRFVEIGKRDLKMNNNLELGTFVRNFSFLSVDLIQVGEHKGPLVACILADIMKMPNQKSLHLIKTIDIFNVSQLEKSFWTIQARKHEDDFWEEKNIS